MISNIRILNCLTLFLVPSFDHWVWHSVHPKPQCRMRIFVFKASNLPPLVLIFPNPLRTSLRVFQQLSESNHSRWYWRHVLRTPVRPSSEHLPFAFHRHAFSLLLGLQEQHSFPSSVQKTIPNKWKPMTTVAPLASHAIS